MLKLPQLRSLNSQVLRLAPIRALSKSQKPPAASSSLSSKYKSLSHILVETIKTTGPLSLSSYMKTCLTHPDLGYYTTKDPIGASGDFVTSPEISQMFGEMIGVWFFTQFLSQRPEKVQFIEFGPGKGTLMFDVLKSFNKLHKPGAHGSIPVEIVMVEASSVLKKEQHRLLCDQEYKPSDDGVGHKSVTKWGNSIRWVDTEEDLEYTEYQKKHNYVICHEFFDALPIKQFEKTKDGWRECLVDYISADTPLPDEKLSLPSQTVIKARPDNVGDEIDNVKFHIVIAPKKTTAAFLPQKSPRHDNLPLGSRVEISPETLMYAKKIYTLIKNGGAGLFVDYGQETIPINTFRGIKDHKIVSPFENPGTVDLSADVDFGGIKLLMENSGGVDVYGPVEQGDWLMELGMGYRAAQLMETAKEEDKERIKKSYLRLVEKGGSAMGKIYKFMGVVPTGVPKPVGFGGDVVD